MKVDYLKIKSRFKNLENVAIEFDEQHLMTVIVGWNGAGKSNVLEALVCLFRDIDLGYSPKFAYEILYKLGDELSSGAEAKRWVKIDANPEWGTTASKQYKVSCKYENDGGSMDLFGEGVWKNLPLSRVVRDKEGRSDYLPRYVFAYYSGPSDRLEGYFRKHRTDFYKRLLNNKLKLKGEIRPFFYAKPIHSQFVLLAFFLGNNEQELKFLSHQLGIQKLEAVHFVLRRPSWCKTENKDEIFWGATGVVREFLDRLLPHALAPIRTRYNETVSITGKGVKNDFLHLFLPDIKALKSVAESLSPDIFFKMLESTLLSELLSEVRVRVQVKNVFQILSFRELSEGEQQLLIILGLLKFTGGRDSLFLLDEPDTHLNPSWTVKYLKFLRDFIPNAHTSHLLMVTHHPLAIAELQKEQVQIMWRESDGSVQAAVPEKDPRGMGYAGILTSDMFGLGSTLDEHTSDLLRYRRALLEKDSLNTDDEEQLQRINRKLDDLGFSTAHWDEDYREYLQARRKAYPEVFSMTSTETPEDKHERRIKAEELMRKLLEQKKLNMSK